MSASRWLVVLRSADLVQWTRLGDALPAKPSSASRTRNFWAPHVSEHGGRYYLYNSAQPDAAVGHSTRGLCHAVATASPAGPFADVGRPLPGGRSSVSIDPMQLDDPATGQPLLYWGCGFEPITVQPLAPDRVDRIVYRDGGPALRGGAPSSAPRHAPVP